MSPLNSSTLPAPLAEVAVGTGFFVELWVLDLSTSAQGIIGGFVDLSLSHPGNPLNRVWADSVMIDQAFPEVRDGTIDNEANLVDDLGGARVQQTLPRDPGWRRLAAVRVAGLIGGVVSFTTSAGKLEFARQLAGNIPWDQVAFSAAPVLVGCIVHNTNDDGPGSLRQAINCANRTPLNYNPLIYFSIPETDPNFIDADSVPSLPIHSAPEIMPSHSRHSIFRVTSLVPS